MKNDLIFNIIAVSISIFTFLFFTIYGSFKKLLIQRAFGLIFNFYELYKILNPYLFLDINFQKQISQTLISQKIFFHGFPKYKYSIYMNYSDFDPLSFQGTIWCDNLSFPEITKFYFFWKLANRKLEKIKKILNKFDYIMKVKNSNEPIYFDSFDKVIEKSSISICPDFDELKMNFENMEGPENYEEEKYDLNKVTNKNIERKYFIKQMKSKLFSVNLRFSNENTKNIYSYSIYFYSDKITKIETFYNNKSYITLIDEDKFNIDNHKKWLEKVFKMDIEAVKNN